MITLPVPVAVMVGACHLAVAAALAVAGAPWVVVFVVAAAATAALFAQRSRCDGTCLPESSPGADVDATPMEGDTVTTVGFHRHLLEVATALSSIETLEGFTRSKVVDEKISTLLGTAAKHIHAAHSSLGNSPVSAHILEGFREHLELMVEMYGEAAVR